MEDPIIKIRKSVLKDIIDSANVAYRALDDITSAIDDVKDGVKKAFSRLEEIPQDVGEVETVEDDDDESTETT